MNSAGSSESDAFGIIVEPQAVAPNWTISDIDQVVQATATGVWTLLVKDFKQKAGGTPAPTITKTGRSSAIEIRGNDLMYRGAQGTATVSFTATNSAGSATISVRITIEP
jgi:hypothetical protein